MNWNTNELQLDQAVAEMLGSENLPQIEENLNNQRLAIALKSLETQPIFLPLQYDMNAAGQVVPYTKRTPYLPYPIILTGALSDNTNRDVSIRRSDFDEPIFIAGDEVNLNMQIGDIAGCTRATDVAITQFYSGIIGMSSFLNPIRLSRGRRLEVDIFKPDTTAGVEQQNFTFAGYRPIKPQVTPEVIADLRSFISRRKAPEMKILKQAIDFDSAIAGGTTGQIYTPTFEEPLIIRGVRTNLEFSDITIRKEGEPDWTHSPTPISVLAQQDLQMKLGSYHWLQRPIYLDRDAVLEMKLTNGYNGNDVDGQNDNFLSWYCHTL